MTDVGSEIIDVLVVTQKHEIVLLSRKVWRYGVMYQVCG